MPTNAAAKEIIKKWYNEIGFPKEYDSEFYASLESIEVNPAATIDTYDINESDGKKNFLYFLYFCEHLYNRYHEKGISDSIFFDTVADMPRWLDTWSELKGGLYFSQLDWFQCHFSMKLFKLGRLQFCFNNAIRDYPEKSIKCGDSVIDIHIPAAGPLTIDECQKSLDMARDFFKKYYPDFKYEYFMCHSWLLDETLSSILNPDSNILAFQKLFDIVGKHEARSILSYVLQWTIKDEEVAAFEPKTSFAKKVKEAYMAGQTFYAGTGFIKK